jgi:glucose-1-phosphate thymidylyltransferase
MVQGIILTGGTGSRLLPQTKLFNKHMLSLNERFIIDYPLASLKHLGVTDLIVVLGGNHFSQVVDYIKNGEEFGFNSTNYVYQEKPSGIAQAINLCQPFIKGNFSVILGDNIYECPLTWSSADDSHAQIMLANHSDLTRFGVASIKNNKIVNIVEKPKTLNQNWLNLAISGCYFFTPQFFDYFKNLQPSARGEYEITDIISKYLEHGKLTYSMVHGLWSDAGTHESINFINNYFYQKKL